MGWKPTGGQTFTLDKAELISAQWSRAAKAHELKIYARHAGVVQLDGFKQEVSGGILQAMTSVGGSQVY